MLYMCVNLSRQLVLVSHFETEHPTRMLALNEHRDPKGLSSIHPITIRAGSDCRESKGLPHSSRFVSFLDPASVPPPLHSLATHPSPLATSVNDTSPATPFPSCHSKHFPSPMGVPPRRSLTLNCSRLAATLTRLNATLTRHSASVDSKPLTAMLSPLHATLTKKPGEGTNHHRTRPSSPASSRLTTHCFFCLRLAAAPAPRIAPCHLLR